MSELERIRSALAAIPPRPEYEDWLRISSAVYSALPEDDAYSVLHEWSPEERKGEYQRKFRSRLKYITAGTLYHTAKLYGWDFSQTLNVNKKYERKKITTVAATLKIPPMTSGSYDDISELGRMRNLGVFAGAQLLANAGILGFFDQWDRGEKCRAWGIMDSSRNACQIRRLDGRKWECIDAKSWTLRGSRGGWPIGIADCDGSTKKIWLVEGGPDLLAASTLAWLEDRRYESHGFACMLGAAQSIDPEAVPLFFGKEVLICAQSDVSGRIAAARWEIQLRDVAESITIWTPRNGDLNDWVSENKLQKLT